MSRIIGIFSDDWVRGLVATLLSVTVVIGFFVGLIPFEFFKDVCIMVLTYFFAKRSDTKLLQDEVRKQVDEKSKINK